jgi:hypothetical protein
MSALISHVISWPTLGCALLVYGFAPGALLRLIVLLYPRDHPSRRELIGELYAYPRIKRPFWVAEQLETALFEGLCARNARHLHRSPASSSQPQTMQVSAIPLAIAHNIDNIKTWEAHLARIAENRAEAAREMRVLQQKLDDPFMRPITEADILRARLDHLEHRDDFLSRLERAYHNRHPDQQWPVSRWPRGRRRRWSARS